MALETQTIEMLNDILSMDDDVFAEGVNEFIQLLKDNKLEYKLN